MPARCYRGRRSSTTCGATSTRSRPGSSTSTSETFAERSSKTPPIRSSSSPCRASATASPAPANSARPSGGGGAGGRPQLTVNRQQAVEVVRKAEAFHGARTGTAAKLLAELGKFDQRAQRQPELSVEILGVEDDASPAQRFAIRANVGRHRRHTARHGLEQGEREPFNHRGQHEHVHGPQHGDPLRFIEDLPGEDDAGASIASIEATLLASASDNYELDVIGRIDILEGTHQEVDVLLGIDAAEIADQRAGVERLLVVRCSG